MIEITGLHNNFDIIYIYYSQYLQKWTDKIQNFLSHYNKNSNNTSSQHSIAIAIGSSVSNTSKANSRRSIASTHSYDMRHVESQNSIRSSWSTASYTGRSAQGSSNEVFQGIPISRSLNAALSEYQITHSNDIIFDDDVKQIQDLDEEDDIRRGIPLQIEFNWNCIIDTNAKAEENICWNEAFLSELESLMGSSYHSEKVKQLLERSIFVSKEQSSALLRTLDNYFHKLLGLLGCHQNIRFLFDSFGIAKIRFELIVHEPKEKRGYLKNNELVEYIKFDHKGFHWNSLNCFEVLEQELDFQKFILSNRYCKHFEYELERVLGQHILMTIDFDSFSSKIQETKQLQYMYNFLQQDNGNYVFKTLLDAFDEIIAYEDDSFVDLIPQSIYHICIRFIPGQNAEAKKFEISNNILYLYLALQIQNWMGVFSLDEYIQIIRYSTLINLQESMKQHRILLLQSCCLMPKVLEKKNLEMVLQLLQSCNYFWKPTNEDLKKVMENAAKRVVSEKTNEKFIKAWHTVKLNKHSMEQERLLVLTTNAYWTFKFHIDDHRLSQKHYKRHALSDFHFVDVTDLQHGGKKCVAMRLFLKEERKKSIFKTQEVKVTKASSSTSAPTSPIKQNSPDPEENRTNFMSPRSKSADELWRNHSRRSTNYSSSLSSLEKSKSAQQQIPYVRQKREKPLRMRPVEKDCYSSVFVLHDRTVSMEEQRLIFLEIAWLLFAVAATCNSAASHAPLEPFVDYVKLEQRTSTTSKFYNLFKMGIHSEQDGSGERRRSRRLTLFRAGGGENTNSSQSGSSSGSNAEHKQETNSGDTTSRRRSLFRK